ncbi:MAG: hypothetical protein GXP59_00280 [Deltaproteobacteria bacterium]|nr:hypothetical protein [Deltaproteobacteria bacterium]
MVNPLAGMTAQALLHKYFTVVCITLTAVLGCFAGWLATVILGIYFTVPVKTLAAGRLVTKVVEQKRPVRDYQVILDRNIFDSTGAAAPGRLVDGSASAVALASLGKKTLPSSASAVKNLVLVGTIAGGSDSLAVIRVGAKIHSYRPGDKIGGVIIKKVMRNAIVIVSPGGSSRTLAVAGARADFVAAQAPSVPSPANQARIKQVGKNKWVIPMAVVERARGNFSKLLTQIRMEPRIVANKTAGFVVRMIRSNSLPAQIGLRLGDVVMGVNNVQLNSPEKALQIFQQLREARHIRVDLLRKGRPLTLEFGTN